MEMIKKNTVSIVYGIVYLLFAILFIPFYKPLLLAALFAFALVPIVEKIKHKLKWKSEPKSVLMALALVSAFFFIPVSIMILKGLSELKDLTSETSGQVQIIDYFQKMGLQINSWIHDLSDSVGIQLSKVVDLNGIVTKISNLVLEWLTVLVKQLPQFMMNYIIFIFSLYFFLVHRRRVFNQLQRMDLLPLDQLNSLKNIFIKVCFTVLVSALIVSATQALIIAVSAALTGQDQVLIIFVITFFMAFIPVVGSVPVSASLILYFAFNSQYGSAGIVLVAAVIAGVSDNVIRTFMLQADDGPHPFVSLLSLIGAITIFGFPGLFIGPIVCELAFQIKNILGDSSTDQIEGL